MWFSKKSFYPGRGYIFHGKALTKVVLQHAAVFVDFRKAFDSVNHQLLLKKLPGYGIKNHELRWFKNYLTSRCQSVVYGGAQSAPQQIKSGVPQGSILGPILFSIYINDLPNCLLQLKILLYADDAVLFYADSNIGNISTVLNKDLKLLQSRTHSSCEDRMPSFRHSTTNCFGYPFK